MTTAMLEQKLKEQIRAGEVLTTLGEVDVGAMVRFALRVRGGVVRD
jgi:hypothetical protein